MISVVLKPFRKAGIGQGRLVMSDYLSLASVAFLCLCVCRTGHETGYIPVLYATYGVIALNIFRLKDIPVGLFKQALPFFAVILFLLPIQALLQSPYYSISNAFSAMALFALFSLCAAVLALPGGIGQYVWRIINFTALSASILILIEYAAYQFGVRLHEIPVLGDWVFNAWEFGSSVFRPCAYFSEASHFAELALVSAFYYLFVRKAFAKFALIAIACLVSTSSLGIMGCAAMALVYVFFFSFTKRRLLDSGAGRGLILLRYLLIVLSCLALMGAVVYIQSSDSWLASRLMNGGSSSLRINRSYELYGLLSPLEKVFGIGLQNQEIYLNANGIILPSDGGETLTNREFAATIGYVLCTCGLIGLASFLSIITPLVALKDNRGKVLSGLFLGISYTCCIFSRAIFIILLLMLFAYGSGVWTFGENADTD